MMMIAHRASSVAQSVLDVFGGFFFGATMCGFFIVGEAFFGGMVLACGSGGSG
jgi:hypothetical protein